MRNIIAYLGCLLAVAACVKSIDLTTGDRLVAVECILADVAPQTLRLGLTTGPTGIEEEALAGAVATLTDLTEQKTVGVFTRADDGLWHLDYAAIPEHKYRLEVEVPGYGATVWAEDTLPPAVNIVYERWPFDRLEETVEDKEFFKEYFYHDFEIPESWENITGKPIIHDITSVFYKSASIPTHTLIQGFVYDETAGKYRLSESLCTDSPGVENCNLDGRIYESKRWLRMEEEHALRVLNPRVDGFYCHNRFLKIEKKKALSQEYFTVSGDFREPLSGFGLFGGQRYIPFKESDNYLLFSAISDNFNAYLNDALSSHLKSEDLTSLYLRENTFSNIKGGVGIFGSVSSQKVPIDMNYTLWELYGF